MIYLFINKQINGTCLPDNRGITSGLIDHKEIVLKNAIKQKTVNNNHHESACNSDNNIKIEVPA